MLLQATDIFFEPSVWTVAHRRGTLLCRKFQGALNDAENWLVGSADIMNAFHLMRIPGWLRAFFALSVVLSSEVGSTDAQLSKSDLLAIL